MEGADGDDRRARRRLVELIGHILGRGGDEVVGDVLAEGMDPRRPVVGQDEPLGLGVALEREAQQVHVFALGPARGRDLGRNGVEFGLVGGRGRAEVGREALLVEGEQVDHAEGAAAVALVAADADHVAAAGVAEREGDGPQRRQVDVEDEPPGRPPLGRGERRAEPGAERLDQRVLGHERPPCLRPAFGAVRPPVQRKKFLNAANMPRSWYRFFSPSSW